MNFRVNLTSESILAMIGTVKESFVATIQEIGANSGIHLLYEFRNILMEIDKQLQGLV